MMYSDYSPPLFLSTPPHTFFSWIPEFGLGFVTRFILTWTISEAAIQRKAMHSSLPGCISSKQFTPGWVGLLKPSSILTVNKPILCSPRAGIPSSRGSVMTMAVFPWS